MRNKFFIVSSFLILALLIVSYLYVANMRESSYRRNALSCYPEKDWQLENDDLIVLDKNVVASMPRFFKVKKILEAEKDSYSYLGYFCDKNEVCDNGVAILKLVQAGASAGFANIISEGEYFEFSAFIHNLVSVNDLAIPLCIYKTNPLVSEGIVFPVYIISQPQTVAYGKFIKNNLKTAVEMFRKM